jgi:hypothetical protein
MIRTIGSHQTALDAITGRFIREPSVRPYLIIGIVHAGVLVVIAKYVTKRKIRKRNDCNARLAYVADSIVVMGAPTGLP